MVFKAIWKPLAITSLVALSLWGLSAWRYSAGKDAGELVANQQWQARWSEHDAADASERAAREKAMRELENKRQKDIEQVAADAEIQLQLARADADRAADIAGGLRTRIAQLRRQLADSETGRLSATAQASAARAFTFVLLADVLSESVRCNEELAAYADRARASTGAMQELVAMVETLQDKVESLMSERKYRFL